MKDARELTLRVLQDLAGRTTGVEQIVTAITSATTPGITDGVIAFVPSSDPDELAVAMAPHEIRTTSRDDLTGLGPRIQRLLGNGVSGLLEPDQTRGITSGPAGLDDLSSAVLAPLVMPGHSPGAVLFWRKQARDTFTADEVSNLVSTTATCAPLLLAAALSDHLLFESDLEASLADAVIAVDPDFRVLRWNRGAEALYGIPAADAVGSPLSTLYTTFYDDPQMSVDRAWEELLRRGRWSGQVTQRSKAGRTVSVSASVNAIRDSSGNMIGAVAVNRDTSEMMLSRSRLDVAEGLLADALNAAGAMAVVIDAQGIILAANREWLDEALSANAQMNLVSVGADYLHPVRDAADAGDANAADVLVKLEEVLSGQLDSAQVTYRCDRPDGPHWFHMEIRGLEGGSRGAVITHRDVTESHRLEEMLDQRGMHDQVTNLGNRWMLQEQIEHASTMGVNRFGLLICDIDDFASVNEAVGYPHGDDALRTIAGRIRSQTSDGGYLPVRLGGDQFAVLAESMDYEHLAGVAERIRYTARQPIDVAGRQLTVSVSIGIATIDTSNQPPGTDVTAELIGRADAARIDSKLQGRNRVRAYRPDLRDRTAALLEMRHNFSAALNAGKLQLHYQQIRRLSDDHVVGFEALVRWPGEGRPVLTPATFGPLISSPLIAGPLAVWSIETGLAAAAALRDHPRLGSATMAVNLSPRQLQDADVASVLIRTADDLGLPLAALAVEITETTALSGDERVHGQITRLHDAGVGISLDDFGTGFSSLEHLRSLPVDCVKVDQSFIAGLSSDPTSQALVRSLIGLGHDLGLVVVAEGVEQRDQRAWLVANGCDLYQGFYAHRPVPLAKCLDL